MINVDAQKEESGNRTLIADGTAQTPVRRELQPAVEKLSAVEREAVRQAALAVGVEFRSDRKALSSEESLFVRDFEILDAAEGFFIYREIRFRAYLYTAYSQKMRRNYQGILVLRALENRTRFETAAHYAYEYRGDRHLRQLPDINGNVLSELAVFSAPPTKKDFRKRVRIIEFSPNGLEKIGSRDIYTQRTASEQPSKKIESAPVIEAVKLYASKEPGKPLEFYEERWTKPKDAWSLLDKLERRPAKLDEDQTAYLELFKPVFPKGPGER